MRSRATSATAAAALAGTPATAHPLVDSGIETGGRSGAGRMLFWDVDTQADFLLPQGHLYVPGAESIIPNLARLTRYARREGVTLISSACSRVGTE